MLKFPHSSIYLLSSHPLHITCLDLEDLSKSFLNVIPFSHYLPIWWFIFLSEISVVWVLASEFSDFILFLDNQESKRGLLLSIQVILVKQKRKIMKIYFIDFLLYFYSFYDLECIWQITLYNWPLFCWNLYLNVSLKINLHFMKLFIHWLFLGFWPYHLLLDIQWDYLFHQKKINYRYRDVKSLFWFLIQFFSSKKVPFSTLKKICLSWKRFFFIAVSGLWAAFFLSENNSFRDTSSLTIWNKSSIVVSRTETFWEKLTFSWASRFKEKMTQKISQSLGKRIPLLTPKNTLCFGVYFDNRKIEKTSQEFTKRRIKASIHLNSSTLNTK